ncbi:MAG: hypothetical protein GX432_10245 [Candidatus Atribacteria bacterium]|nr:hypothetical protein [Candidatus Atribacteria bacterium]
MMIIPCQGRHYREVNKEIELKWKEGIRNLSLHGVNGQRYIGRSLSGEGLIEVNGVPGDDLGMFMDGATLLVHGNAQDGVGNTMNSGKIIVEGDIRDIAGYAMRGGKIWVKGNVGYRVGIHMKSYLNDYPVIMIGGASRDFLGEYMAGGLIVVLGLGYESSCSPVGKFIASGMHGGKMFIRGRFQPEQAGPGIGIDLPTAEDFDEIMMYYQEFLTDLGLKIPELKRDDFVKVFPTTTRPYGRVYAY